MEKSVSVMLKPEAGVRVISKYALPLAPVANAPVRAALPKLLVPLAPAYTEEADVVEIIVSAPLTLPCDHVPTVTFALDPEVAALALLQSHT